ncbi:AraC family transcriptional regulator ligand-binding domain-containing protein [Methylocella sp.]|jgi:AraC-like DNA-binding protein|uniref:AraC family transcriptional regulator n=1 Tax=Methylocella sp. TaxID=1978226 RepID=UPI003C17F6C1
MRSYGLTRARSMGPVADIVERSGGSVARVFRRAELPLRLIDEPDRLILLKDQLNLVECAAREIADDALAARLSTEAGFASLGPYGRQIETTPRLDEAIVCASATIGSLLQSSTRLNLTVSGGFAKWTYGVTDRIEVGRQKNEMLAFGYMLDLIRRFAGAGWTPSRVELPGPPLAARAAIENVFRCDLSRGEAAMIAFPAELLEMPNPWAPRPGPSDADELPDPEDIVACVAHLIRLGLLDGRPNVDWLCRRLQIPRRSLQRELTARGVSFERLLRQALLDRSSDLLTRTKASVTTAALELGYGDPAHFSRAFRRWTGESPRGWRRSRASGA